MKKIIRLCCMVLCLATLAGLCSCVQIGSGDENTPDGMQIASSAGSDFYFYVPTTWVVNTAYGISCAYRDLSRQSTVSLVKYAITDEWRTQLDQLETATTATTVTNVSNDTAESESGENVGISGINQRLTWFFENECLRPVKETALDGKVTIDEENSGADMLDKVDAGRWCYTALVSGTTYHYKQLIVEKNDAFYVFTFTATEEMYEQYLSDVEKILNAFCFSDKPYYPDYAKKLDESGDAPEGMKACYGADVAYKFYVPTEWEIDLDTSIYSAYLKSDYSSVSVVPYMPTVEHLSVAEYWQMVCDETVKLLGDSAMTVYEDQTHKENLGSREATVYEYTCKIGGKTYRYRQYISAYRSMIYSLTYCASEEHFDEHLSDVERMVSAFEFR